jgi:tRNA threonylcarbamoyladenosine biosynthesis protein TsaE
LLGSNLKGGEVIDLRSDLGGGKTTFVRGLAQGAGSKNIVTSPTFTLSRIYNAGKLQIHHFDFYRLDDPGILADQLAESVNNGKAAVVVDWSDIVANVLPDNRISVEFKPTAKDPDERQITINYPESKRNVIIALENQWQAVEP